MSRSNLIPSGKGYNRSLHGFRGFAAGTVFVFHIFSAKILPRADFYFSWDQILFFTSSLRYGVELFFMISGYVIIASLVRHASLGQFFIDRALRIYPAFVPVHLLVFALGPFVVWGPFVDLTIPSYVLNFIGNLLFLPSIFPVPLAHWAAWSLSYEWAFYAIAAVWLVTIRNTTHGWRWLVVSAFSAALLVMLNYYPRGIFFAPGVLVFLLERQIREYRRAFAFPVLALFVCLISWRLTEVDSSTPSSQLLEWCLDGRVIYALVGFSAGFYLLASVILGSGAFGRLLSSKPALALGTISYSFYLWHPVVIVVVKKCLLVGLLPGQGTWLGTILFVGLSLSLSLVVSVASWRLFEVELTKFIKDRAGRDSGTVRVAKGEAI